MGEIVREPVMILGGKVVMYVGDVLAKLRSLPSESVDCVVTSPPYWGLRDYGVDGQIGLERSLAEHIAIMVEVFEEIRRVLKPGGTLWLNYGDCYASTPNGKSAADYKAEGKDNRTFRDKPVSTVGPIYNPDHHKGDSRGNTDCLQKRNEGSNHTGRIVAGGYLKPKDLCMMPNRLAIALQDAGWWVRSEIIWGKPNPMPESIKDRPATAHEKIWLLTKSERYFYDHHAVRIGGPGYQKPNAPNKIKSPEGQGFTRRAKKWPSGWAQGQGSHDVIEHNQGARSKPRAVPPANDGYSNHTKLDETGRGNGRRLRNWEPAPAFDVWEIATSPFPDAHFATFPVALAERCILAGCPKGGVVLDCFGGSGSTALAAYANDRETILIELNPEYAEIAVNWIEAAFTSEGRARRKALKADLVAGPLFTGEVA